MQHYEPECLDFVVVVAILKVRVIARAHMIKI